MNKFNVAGIGEILWDLLPGGRQLGGAPANFASHAAALGADARILSRVGNDGYGRAVLEHLRRIGIPTGGIEVDDDAPTGTATVDLAPDGQPHFTIHQPVAWDYFAGANAGDFRRVDAVCFGTLGQRNLAARTAIQMLLRETRKEALRIFDINLRQHYYSAELIRDCLGLASLLKVNELELPRLAEIFNLSGGERSQIEHLALAHGLRAVAYTRGGKGSLLWAGGRWSDHPGVPVQVVDTVGAGDAFTAALTLGILHGWDLEVINRRANEVAAWVASNAGATPALPERLSAPFHSAMSGGRTETPASQP